MKITGASCIFLIEGGGLLVAACWTTVYTLRLNTCWILNNIGPTPSKEGRVPNGSQLCLKQVFASKRTSTNGD